MRSFLTCLYIVIHFLIYSTQLFGSESTLDFRNDQIDLLFYSNRLEINCFNNSSIAQEPQLECGCCKKGFDQFDFWIGEWEVLDTLGNTLGYNTIEKSNNYCFIEENWRGSSGGSGKSFNYYNKRDSSWNQIWINGNGNVLELKGKYKNGKMILRSDLINNSSGSFYNQISWELRPNGSVIQLWESFDQDGMKLKTVFKGIYLKKN